MASSLQAAPPTFTPALASTRKTNQSLGLSHLACAQQRCTAHPTSCARTSENSPPRSPRGSQAAASATHSQVRTGAIFLAAQEGRPGLLHASLFSCLPSLRFLSLRLATGVNRVLGEHVCVCVSRLNDTFLLIRARACSAQQGRKEGLQGHGA